MEQSQNKVLYIGPNFYEYPKEISKSLNNIGFEVDFFPHVPLNLIFRLLKNISISASNKYINRYYNKLFSKISLNQYTHFLLISGKFTPIWFLEKLKLKLPNAKFIMYQWDSIHNNSKIIKLLTYFHVSYSFDLVNTLNIEQLKYLPLFYSKTSQNTNLIEEDIDLLFVGNPLSNRYKRILQLKQDLLNYSFKHYFYFYLPFVQYLKEIIIRKNYLSIKNIYFSKLTAKQYAKILGRSKVVLDIHDPNQSGLTMRTIETLGANKKLITTNKYIRTLTQDKERVLFTETLNSKEIIDFLLKSSSNKSLDQVTVLSSLDWVKILFEMKTYPH